MWAPGSASFLCVKSTTQRRPSSNSGGRAGNCDGALAIDCLAYLATHPSALGQPCAAGDMAWWRARYCDPPAPGTINLSNALQATLCP